MVFLMLYEVEMMRLGKYMYCLFLESLRWKVAGTIESSAWGSGWGKILLAFLSISRVFRHCQALFDIVYA
jgi:hypothetical protein